MRLILIIFSAILFSPNCIAQKTAKVSDKVRLIWAKSEDCDITMDVTRLKEGYDLEYTDSSTIVPQYLQYTLPMIVVPSLNLQLRSKITDYY